MSDDTPDDLSRLHPSLREGFRPPLPDNVTLDTIKAIFIGGNVEGFYREMYRLAVEAAQKPDDES